MPSATKEAIVNAGGRTHPATPARSVIKMAIRNGGMVPFSGRGRARGHTMRRQYLMNRQKPRREHPLNTRPSTRRIDSAFRVAHLTPAMILVHGTTVALEGEGVLLRGPSGGGKSDLALRLIDAGARLVADDQTEIACEAQALVARSPQTIAGRIEVRGVGIIKVPTMPSAPVRLAVDLVAPDRVERLPEPRVCEYLR